MVDAVRAEARAALDVEGAQAVVLGCAGLGNLVAPLTVAFGVPVVDRSRRPSRWSRVCSRRDLSTKPADLPLFRPVHTVQERPHTCPDVHFWSLECPSGGPRCHTHCHTSAASERASSTPADPSPHPCVATVTAADRARQTAPLEWSADAWRPTTDAWSPMSTEATEVAASAEPSAQSTGSSATPPEMIAAAIVTVVGLTFLFSVATIPGSRESRWGHGTVCPQRDSRQTRAGLTSVSGKSRLSGGCSGEKAGEVGGAGRAGEASPRERKTEGSARDDGGRAGYYGKRCATNAGGCLR
ncbi:hypothetical protein [Frankia sp. R82]|uniref:hypothetical protein n=1 Tax=Frankia sp. R82 TaxID=2950553 RepID=UPI0035AB9893